MDRKYTLKVPVTHYEEIKLTPGQITSAIYQEMKFLVGNKWDGIVLRGDGTGYYYEDYYNYTTKSPDADQALVELYSILSNAARYFNSVKETQ